MTGPAIPYLIRLLGLSLSAGLAVYAVTGFLSWTLAPWALRRAEAADANLRDPESTARMARGLLALRLLPPFVSVLIVGGWCVPSYLWLEPRGGAERVGLVFCLAAGGGACLAVITLRRLARAVWASWRFNRQCQASGETRVCDGGGPILVIPGQTPLLALVGIFRPKLVISRGVLDHLAPEQLQAALRHEQAHRRTRDNLKRLLLLAAPALVPGVRFGQIERAWARLAEWSADDAAVASAPRRSATLPPDLALTLASTLVAVARLGTAPAPTWAISHFTQSGNDRDLADRVQRLLAAAPAPPAQGKDCATRLAVWAGATFLLVLMLQPTTLIAVHEVLEHLIH